MRARVEGEVSSLQGHQTMPNQHMYMYVWVSNFNEMYPGTVVLYIHFVCTGIHSTTSF